MTTNHHAGRTDELAGLQEEIELSSASEARVLITGAPGPEKDLIAQTIHRRSPRASRPFVAVQCAGVTEARLESELFGALNGESPAADRPSALEMADHGTVFLDEIGQLTERLQCQLVQFLESGALQPAVGQSRRLDVRIIAAASGDLWQSVSQGRFRADLYYRLNVIHIVVPRAGTNGKTYLA